MLLRLLFLIFGFQALLAQDRVAILVDSLAQTTIIKERSAISLAIAKELQQTDWSRTLYYLDIAKENAVNSGADKELADYYQASGNIYSNKDALDIALAHFLKAYDFYQEKEPSERFRLENNLAIVYARIDNRDKALEYFRKVYNYQKQKKDTLYLAQILNNMGNLYRDKNVDSALVYFNKSLVLSQGIEDPNLTIYLYTNLGRCYLSKEQPDTARSFFKKALHAVDSITNTRTASWLFTEMSEFYLNEKQIDSSLLFSKKTVAINDSLAPFGFEQQKAVSLLYQGLVADRDYKQATSYFKKYDEIRDSLDLEDKRVNVEKVLIEQEYRNKEKIRELEESKKRFRYYMILLGMLAVLLLLVVLLVRFKNKLKNTELEKELAKTKQKELQANIQLKNKELIGKAMVEMHRTEIVEEILTDLKQIKRNAAKKETQQAIDYIVKRLKRDADSNIWEEFEIRFEQVHESFYKNLIKKHPVLTIRDKRLCALLKLNLTSKEIAQITGQSLKSVENARTRLRKKLDITYSDTDLSSYLFNFN